MRRSRASRTSTTSRRPRCRSSSTSSPPSTRDDRLIELIDRIRSDDTAAYLPFRDAAELEERVGNDLATLLAERFDQSRGGRRRLAGPASPHRRVPVPYTPTIGREEDLRRRPRHPRDRHRPRGEPHRAGRDRQEPTRDRGRARDGGPVSRRDVLRAARGRARDRPAAAHDRVLPRSPRHRRRRTRRAHRARHLWQAGPDRPRQLRADRGCRSRCSSASTSSRRRRPSS